MPLKVSDNFAKFISPCRILLAGSTACGKSYFIRQLLEFKDRVFSESNFQRIIYVMPEGSRERRTEYLESLEKVCPDIECIQGFPKTLHSLNLVSDNEPKLLILDDLVQTLMANKSYLNLMIVDSHHSNIR